MSLSESIRYLEGVGIHYKPAESPDLWTHLESHFAGPHPIGPKFSHLPASRIADMIGKGEEALLAAMVEQHRRTGRIGHVTRSIDMPYVVGTAGTVSLATADKARVLTLVEQPGSVNERLVHVMPVAVDDIPSTHQVTITGGTYPDGHTAGYYDLQPGHPPAGSKDKDACVYLATEDEIIGLAREMEEKIEDIVVVTRKECDALLKKVKKALGG